MILHLNFECVGSVKDDGELKSQTEYTVHSEVLMSLWEQGVYEYDSKVIHLGTRLTWGGFG